MGEFAKVVRWTAPGATAILVAALVVAAGRALLRLGAGYPGALITVDSGLVALLVAAAVPTGFLIYQLYFYLHSRVEGVIFQFVHEDVGLKVLTDLGLGDQAVQSNWFTVARPGLYLRFPRGASIPLTGETNSLWWSRSGGWARFLRWKHAG